MRFPLRDVITPRTTPVVTWGLIGITLLLHVVFNSAGPAFACVLLIASNTLALWIFGENVEDQTGHRRFLLFYFVCGAAAALTHARLNPLDVVTSAVVPSAVLPSAMLPAAALSGAAAAVMGGYLVMFLQSRVLVRVPLVVLEVPAVLFLLLWWLLQLLASPVVSASAFAGQVTGLVTGAALIRLFRRPERARWEWREP